LRNKPIPPIFICATFASVLTKPVMLIGFLFCFPSQSPYNAPRLSVEWFQPLICENAITTISHPIIMRSIPAPQQRLNFSTSFLLWSPILNYVLHYQARFKSFTDGTAAGIVRFILHHNL
jgi:hypothetical protein